MEKKFHIGFSTYEVDGRWMASGEIRCWKTCKVVSKADVTNTVMLRVDYQVFTDIDAAIDYIVLPLIPSEYELTMND